jgi:hypothetical protein
LFRRVLKVKVIFAFSRLVEAYLIDYFFAAVYCSGGCITAIVEVLFDTGSYSKRLVKLGSIEQLHW